MEVKAVLNIVPVRAASSYGYASITGGVWTIGSKMRVQKF